MKFSHQAVISAPVDRVDLEEWLFTLSDSDYQAAARGHRAAGTFTENGVRGTVNVESMGGTLMVQHYHAVSAEPTRVEMLSTRSHAYVMHLIPVHFLVRWTMTATPRTDRHHDLQLHGRDRNADPRSLRGKADWRALFRPQARARGGAELRSRHRAQAAVARAGRVASRPRRPGRNGRRRSARPGHRRAANPAHGRAARCRSAMPRRAARV